MKIVIIGLVSILILGGFSTTGIYNGVTDAIYTNNEINPELSVESEDAEAINFERIDIDAPLTFSVYLEKDLIVIHVVDQDGNNVQNALVEILGYNIEDSTGMLGNAWLTAPSVNADTWVTIRAEKRDKIDEISILIKNKHLYVSAPSSVDEAETFNVFVTNQDGKAVIGAKVTFDYTTKYTDINGKVTFTAPYVKANTGYNIIASAPLRSYGEGEKQINVINKGNEIVVLGSVVGDDGANGWVPVDGAKISVNNKVMATTDRNGHYSFVFAPTTTSSLACSYTIIASHGTYGQDSWSGSIYGTDEIIYVNFALK